jgi:predicted  nucleic acid-binding Zn-ribbon protein
VSDLEDKALAMLDSVKQSEIDIQRAEETLKATEERLKIEEKELSAEQERVEREVAYQQENRKKAVSLLPNDVAKKYERIHAKVKRKTVVPVDVDVDKERFICTGCYMSITVQEWNEILRAEELIYCRQCNRILFAPDTV